MFHYKLHCIILWYIKKICFVKYLKKNIFYYIILDYFSLYFLFYVNLYYIRPWNVSSVYSRKLFLVVPLMRPMKRRWHCGKTWIPSIVWLPLLAFSTRSPKASLIEKTMLSWGQIPARPGVYACIYVYAFVYTNKQVRYIWILKCLNPMYMYMPAERKPR